MTDLRKVPSVRRKAAIVVQNMVRVSSFLVLFLSIVTPERALSQAGQVASSSDSSGDWLAEVSTCEQLRGEIRTRFGAVSDLSKFADAAREELQRVIEVACSERFAGCRFKVCAQQSAGSSSQMSAGQVSADSISFGPVSSESSASSQQSSAMNALELRGAAASLSNQILIAPLSEASSETTATSSRTFSAESSSSLVSSLSASSLVPSSWVASSVEASSSNSSSRASSAELSSAALSSTASSSSRSLPFVVDPLAWLSSSLSCEQFLEQAQVRYAVFGAYENFPEEKQKEIRIVLATGCEEKFEACNFPMCPLTQRSVSDAVDLLLGNVASSSSEIPPAISSPAPTSAIASAAESVATSAEASSPAPSVEEEEWKSYRSLVERVKKERRELIAAAEKREKEQGLVWKRFIIPEDVQEEREEVVRESKADSTKTSAVNNAASPNTGRSTSPSGASGASQTSNEKPLRGPSERLPGAQPDSSSENGGLFDQDANNLQIGILPPLPPSPPVDPHRRK